MPKYIISATETNTYSMEVEAVSEEFARMKASLEMIDGDWIHVDNDFTITNVVLTNE